MKIGVTGATGGLGRRFVEILSEKQDVEIRALVRPTSNLEGIDDKKIEFVFGSLEEPSSLEQFVKGLDVCYHFASCVSSSNKLELIATNVKGTQNLCESLLQNPNCHLIYCSSIVVKNINNFNRAFASDYTLSKYYAEEIVKKHNKEIPVTIVYPGYIYGKYDRNLLPSIIKLLSANVKFLLGGGQRKAPLVYIDDLCELFWLCAVKKHSIGKGYVGIPLNKFGMHHFIQAVGKELELAYPEKIYPKLPFAIIAKLLDVKYNFFGGNQPKLTMRVVNGLSAKARYTDDGQNDLGWKPQTTLGNRVKESIDFYTSFKEAGVNNTIAIDIITLKNDGRCKWLENKVLRQLLPQILDNNNNPKNKKIYVIEDWISNDGGKVGVDLGWLHRLGVPVAKNTNDLPEPQDCIVVNTGYDSIYDEEKEIIQRGFEFIDAPCPFVRKLREHLISMDAKYQCVLLCEPNHIIIKNYASLFPADMILVEMDDYREKIMKQQNGKPLFLLPYVTFLPKHVISIHEFICTAFPERKNSYVETKCMWVSSKLSPVVEINSLSEQALHGIEDALLITTAGSTNKSVISLTETLEMKKLNVVTIGSLENFKEYLKTCTASRLLLVKSPIPNNAEKPILDFIKANHLGGIS